jgi:hypothetical protein
MLKSKGQIAIIIIGLISLGLGIKSMLRVPTVILPPWFLVLLYVPIIVGFSFFLGLLIKALIKIEASKLTYTSFFVTIFSLAFYISEYKPTYEIIVPEKFNGVVNLYLSKEEKNDFRLNSFGIGYICKKTFYNGFKPKAIKNGHDITNELSDFYSGTVSSVGKNGNFGPYQYLSFKISPHAIDTSTLTNNLQKMIELNILDTTRILKTN